MAVTFGFYNSVAGDRVYDAIQMSSIFDGIITDGVFQSIGSIFDVSPGSGMQVIVATGKAWFDHTWTLNDSDLSLSIDPADVILPRIDIVILEVDASTGVRSNSIKILKGTSASVPVAPTLINTAEVHQYPLGYITVGAGVTSIVGGNITQAVGTGACPFVTVPQTSNTGLMDVLQVQIFS